MTGDGSCKCTPISSQQLCGGITYVLQRHNTEYSKQIFTEKELRGHSPNSYIDVSVGGLYIPTIGLPILPQENRWTDKWEYTDRSQTHECGNWDAHFLLWEYINRNSFAVCSLTIGHHSNHKNRVGSVLCTMFAHWSYA